VPPIVSHAQYGDIGITLDTYTHVLPALQREAADAMDRALGLSRDP